MSNWFEDNPSKSVITYTLLVAGATWAISTFILQDDRLNLARSELEAEKSISEQYKAKTELLQRDIDAIRAENAEYRTWLGQTKDAIPSIVPRILELRNKIANLESASPRSVAAIPSSAPSSSTASATAISTEEKRAVFGTAYIDNDGGVIFTVRQTYPDRKADVTVKLPDKAVPIRETIDAGAQWKFKSKGKNYVLTVTSIGFINDSVYFRVDPTS